jgi:hypothetical protein
MSSEADAVFRIGMQLVDSGRSDAELCDEIRRVAHGDGSVLKEAADHARVSLEFGEWHDTDRAVRLFAAAVDVGAVQPPDPTRAEFFASEKALAALGHEEAVRQLWRLSEELERWCRATLAEAVALAAPVRNRRMKVWRLRRQIDAMLPRLLGPAARVPADPLLRSTVAEQHVRTWIHEECRVRGGLDWIDLSAW